MNFPFDENTRCVCRNAAIQFFPNVPLEVVLQVIVDHGRNPDFQEQYGHIDFDHLNWTKDNLPGDYLCQSTRFHRSNQLFANCIKRTSRVAENGWKYVDSRKDVSAHWERSGTWLLPPVLISSSLVGKGHSLHIVEGHTRLGNLSGLIQAALIDGSLCHSAWVGRPSLLRTP